MAGRAVVGAALAAIGLAVGCAPEIGPGGEAEPGRAGRAEGVSVEGASTGDARGASSPVRRAPVAPPEGTTPSEPGGAPAVTYTMISVRAGAELEIELLDPVGPAHQRPGDAFRAAVTRPLIENDTVMVPLNSLVHGAVTAIGRSPDAGGEILLKLDISDVFFNGTEWPMSSAVVAVLAPPGSRSAGEGAGMAATLVGRVLGGQSAGTVIGAAAGATAGTAILLPAGEGEAPDLPAGTILRLRLDEEMTYGLPHH